MTPLRHLTHRQRIAIAVVLGVVLGLIVASFVWTVVSNHERISEIQASRISSSELACQQQDERHERLYAQIEATAENQRLYEPSKYRETVAKARELEQLLNAVQPEEDCRARARLLIEETLGHEHAKRQKPIRKPGPLRLPLVAP